MIWCHCRACLCESYEASASEENTCFILSLLVLLLVLLVLLVPWACV